jgi:hypothetical protein
MVMELLQGESLASLLGSVVRLPVEQAAKVLDQCFAGLEAAHAKGVIHRDLKPENIYVDQRTPEWKVTLLDFGLALKTTSGDAKLTQPGTVVGTPGYMAPEQVRGEARLTFKTDVYAMGVVAWTILAGREPFAGGSIVEIMHRHLRDKAPPLRREAPNTPPELEALVMQMLEKDPDARPTDREVRAVLGTYLPSSRTSLPAPPAPPATPKWMFAGLGIAAVVLAVVTAFMLLREDPQAPAQVSPIPGARAAAPRTDAGAGPAVAEPRPVATEPRPIDLTPRAAATWRCDQITSVEGLYRGILGGWVVFLVYFDAKTPPLMVGLKHSDSGHQKLKALQGQVKRCMAVERNKKKRPPPKMLSAAEASSGLPWILMPLKGNK